MVTCAGPEEGRSLEESAQRAVAVLGKLIDHGKSRGIGIAIHNCHITNFADHPAAWDFQYLIPHVEVGKWYRRHARLVYKPFEGRQELLAQVAKWDGACHAEGAHDAWP